MLQSMGLQSIRRDLASEQQQQKSNIVSAVNNDSLISSFLIWIPFIYFSCLITVSMSSNTYIE